LHLIILKLFLFDQTLKCDLSILNSIEFYTDSSKKIQELTEKFASVSVHHVEITPSSTASTKNLDDFLKVLEWLRLDLNADFTELVSVQHTIGSEVTFPKFRSYSWKDETGGDIAEIDGYPFLLNYLVTDCRLFAKIIANGQGMSTGNLFDERVFSLRDRLAPGPILRQENKIPVYKFHISGRTDIVVLDSNILCKTMVKFAIEVKTINGMRAVADERQSLREAFLQLIGLNIGNDNKSPAVILTNLNSKHYVLYLEPWGDPELRLNIRLKILKFSKFEEVLHFANELSNRVSFTGRFGTDLTPGVSEAGYDNEECTFSNVRLDINDEPDLLDSDFIMSSLGDDGEIKNLK